MANKNIFKEGSKEYDRVIAFRNVELDPYPNSSNSEVLEEMFTCLFSGKDNPYPLDIPGYNGRTRKRKEAEYPIQNSIYLAMCELFKERV